MDSNFLFGISLTGSFLAGSVALFAPCCITILLPSYLGTIFKKTEKVFFYTLVFSLGLAAVLMPVALGFRLIISVFDSFHQQFYFLGAFLLIAIGLMTYFEMKLPSVFRLEKKTQENIDMAAVFSLGVFSGISSSCCAPVLFAAITLTSLSPTILQAILVASAYVMGIVFPLFLLSLFYQKLSRRFLAKAKKKIYRLFKLLASATFIFSGIIIGSLAYLGKIEMGQIEGYTIVLRLLIFKLAQYFRHPLVDLFAFAVIIFFFYQLLKNKQNERR